MKTNAHTSVAQRTLAASMAEPLADARRAEKRITSVAGKREFVGVPRLVEVATVTARKASHLRSLLKIRRMLQELFAGASKTLPQPPVGNISSMVFPGVRSLPARPG
jgi:hypothetical protein